MKNPDNLIVLIYMLVDPRDSYFNPRYVGITALNPNKRLRNHIKGARHEKPTHKTNWINSLIKDGITPKLIVFAECVGWNRAQKEEQFWIKQFKEAGYNLTNSTDGGEGTFGKIVSESVRAAVALANSQRVISEETRAKLSASRSGKNHFLFGKHHSDETRQKIKQSWIKRRENKPIK